MNVTLIDQEPAGKLNFVRVPETDDVAEFVKNLSRLLEQGTASIETGDVPLDWVNAPQVQGRHQKASTVF
jgi:hypothetical protein